MPRRILMRAVVVVATLATSLVVTVEGAHAAAGINGSLAAPTPVFVGQSGLPASLTAINTNSPPQQTETNTWTTIRVAPTCAAAPAAPNPCPSPELGVFALSATGSGATGTACAGMTFNISAPDASGIVTFAPVGTVVLQPPGGPVGSDRCTINYTFSVLKLPNVDTNLGTGGTQTRMNARMQVTSSPTGLQPAANPSLEITVVPGSPDISTQVSSSSVFLGGTVTDTATVTVGPVGPPVTGTVTFNLYGPNDPTCSGISIFTSANRPLTSGVATSSPYTPTAVGTYRFVAVYSGDANYSAVSGLCNEAGETFVVSVARKPAADFDGDGDTDVSVFRPSNATWFTLGGSPASVVWGAVGDVPVPADYDGDGNVDEAVFRPSNNTWFLRTNAPQSIVWGAAGDIPVPADYDGNGTADLAVFRPSNGTWFIRTPAPQSIAWGANGDVPVPADYDGNGSIDLAVFRPGTNTWFLRTPAPQSIVWGAAGDIPVPGDYDGNGSTDLAVFRPASGTWFLRTPAPQAIVWGANGDIPNPGYYDVNATTDLAVFRPSTNVWYVKTPAPTSPLWGASGDIPLPLPHSIRRFFF